jgi:hypothetical protein
VVPMILGSKRPHSVGAFGGAIDAVDSALTADAAA